MVGNQRVVVLTSTANCFRYDGFGRETSSVLQEDLDVHSKFS